MEESKRIVLHFWKLEVKFKNHITLTFIANSYPYSRKKEDRKTGFKNYSDQLKLEIKNESSDGEWIEKFCELKKNYTIKEKIDKFPKHFLKSLSENYDVEKITGYDIPVREDSDELDEERSISIVLYAPSEEKHKQENEKLKIFDRCSIRITETASYSIIAKREENKEENLEIALSEEEISRKFLESFGEKKNQCTINFNGHTFFGNVLILENGEISAFLPLLVFPTKLSPEEAETILNDLLHSRKEIVKKEEPTKIFIEPHGAIQRTPLLTLLLINSMFTRGIKNLPSLGKTLRAIASSPDKLLISEKVKRDITEVTMPDEVSIFEAVISGDIKPSELGCHFYAENRGFSFTSLFDERIRISYDTYSNRFIKYFLGFLKNTIRSCVEKLENEKVMDSLKDSLTKNVNEHKVRYITPLLNSEWMGEVSKITYLPPPPQKLLKDPFYSTTFSYYLDLISMLKLADEELEKFLHNPIAWMPELYELWCRLKLEKIAEELGLKFEHQHYYERKRKTDNWYSYSVPLRPDFRLERSDGNVLIFLDAKYRVEWEEYIIGREGEKLQEIKEEERRGKFKLVDLYKMHTYREAIRKNGNNPRWVIILYPGDKGVLYCQNGKKIEFEEVKEDDFGEISKEGGVGAFPFRPKKGEEDIKKIIKALFEWS